MASSVYLNDLLIISKNFDKLTPEQIFAMNVSAAQAEYLRENDCCADCIAKIYKSGGWDGYR